MIRNASWVTWQQRVADRRGRAGSGGSLKDHRYNNTAFPVIKDKGRAVNGPWYHPGSSRPHGTRPWLHGDLRINAITMHRLDNGSHLLQDGAPVAAYFTSMQSSNGFGARLEGLVR